ncbi:DUF6161 domain-containing protein [uncultured Sphingomonas sp.]|uniref:DUF6161 domain-containing protein n=1 Tax=uncultured Sphingomonas sp. TaxID=158754 RepID=UPI0025FC56E7|nr:DUF6161 domain-containing protein [uncultured Sphingomonas sp.]
MIFLTIPSERGGEKEFGAIDELIVWSEEQLAEWVAALRFKTDDFPHPGINRLVQVWQSFSKEIRQKRSNYTSRQFHRIEAHQLVTITSPLGTAFRIVYEELGWSGVDTAIWYELYRDNVRDVDWSVAANVAAITLFLHHKERLVAADTKNKREELEERLYKYRNDALELQRELQASKDKHESSKSDLRDQIEAALEGIEKFNQVFRRECETMEAMMASLSSDVAAARSTFSDELVSARAEAKSDLDAWSKAHVEQARLQHPATLWAERAEKFEKSTRRQGIVAVVVGILGLLLGGALAFFCFKAAASLFKSFIIPAVVVKPVSSSITLDPTFHFSLITAASVTLVYLTLFLWLMRILVRGRDTEHHLVIDAQARAAMTETYLGLVKENAASDTERSLVLSALFRPVIDGMVKDDGPPAISPTAILATMTSGSSK